MIETFFILLMGHFLCDYPLQGEFLSKFKAQYIDTVYNPIWYHALVAHCAIHSLFVLFITGSWLCTSIMFISHFIIDTLKCRNYITFDQDQGLHIFVLACIASLTYFI